MEIAAERLGLTFFFRPICSGVTSHGLRLMPKRDKANSYSAPEANVFIKFQICSKSLPFPFQCFPSGRDAAA